MRRFEAGLVLACLAFLGAAGCSERNPTAPAAVIAPGLTPLANREDRPRSEVPDLDDVARFVGRIKATSHVSAQIGPEGGTVRNGDFQIIVPAGAVSRSTLFMIRIPNDQPGKHHAVAEMLPHNVTFAVPVTVILPIEDTQSAGTGAHVMWWNSYEWVKLETTPTADGRIQAQTRHLSYWATQKCSGYTVAGG
jgi:hypothetical protein